MIRNTSNTRPGNNPGMNGASATPVRTLTFFLITWTVFLAADIAAQDAPVPPDARQLLQIVEDQRRMIEQQAAAMLDLKNRVVELERRETAPASGDLDAILTELQKRVEEKSKNNKNPFGRPTNDTIRWGGYFTLNFEDRGGDHSTFNAYRLVPQLEADIAQHLTFGTEIEIEHGGANADFLDDDEIVIEYAELRASIAREFNIKAGVILLPFLSYNQRHDDPLHNISDRPYTATNLIPTAFAQPGIAVYGAFDAVDALALNYDIALSNGFDNGFDTIEGARESRSPFNEDNNNNKMLTGRLGFVPRTDFLDAVDGGLSFLFSKYDDENRRRINGYGADIFIKKGPFDVRGEWGAFDLKRKNTTGIPDDKIALDPVTGADHPPGLRGWYVEGAFHFFPLDDSARKHFPFTTESDLAIVVRFQEMDLNTSTIGATPTDDLHSTTVGLAFRPNAKMVIRISYEFVRSAFHGPSPGQDSLVFGLSTYF